MRDEIDVTRHVGLMMRRMLKSYQKMLDEVVFVNAQKSNGKG